MTRQDKPPAGQWKATLVHSNDDAIEKTFESLDTAKAWAAAEEAHRHTDAGTPTIYDHHYSLEKDHYVQYGMDLHYVMLEKVTR